eukprot:g44222.t1
MDVSVLTAYKSELRRVATILKDKDHVKKRKRAEPEEEQPHGCVTGGCWPVNTGLGRGTTRWLSFFGPGYHKVVIFFWDEQKQGTEGPWWRIVLRLPSEKGWFMLNMDGGTDWRKPFHNSYIRSNEPRSKEKGAEEKREGEDEKPWTPRMVLDHHMDLLIDVADDTDEDEAPQQVEPAAPPAPPAPSPPATCAHLCSADPASRRAPWRGVDIKVISPSTAKQNIKPQRYFSALLLIKYFITTD